MRGLTLTGRWTLTGTLVAVGLASAGCSLEQRINHLEHKQQEADEAAPVASLVKWHKMTVERLAAIERREERLRIEIARLEKWQNQLAAREAALAKGGTPTPAAPTATSPTATNPAPAPSPRAVVAPPLLETPAAPVVDKMYVQAGANPWSDPFAAAAAKGLAQLFATGEKPKDAQFLDGKDETGTPVAPRNPGKVGEDGQHLVGSALKHTRFIASTGDPIDLERWKGKKNVVLVVLRGFDGAICVACSGQTLAISENLDEFQKRDAEVFLLYPGKAESVPVFLDAVRDLGGGGALPVEILLDVDLAVVHDFQIEGKLAKPTTIILDKKGVVQFAHVGRNKTDRPTVPQMLETLDRLQAQGH